MAKRTFSNGTEYECFLATYCESCRRFVDWPESYEDDMDENSRPNCCPIETAMAEARFEIDLFPDNFIKPDKNGSFECSAYCKGTHPMLAKPEKIPDFWKFENESKGR